MKYQTTAKQVVANANPDKLLAIPYASAQFLLNYENPRAYTCGVYGWNFDVYEIDGWTITTGYRNTKGRKPNNLKEYEEKARAIDCNYDLDYNQRKEKTCELLLEFLNQA